MALIGYSDRPDRPINETQWACGGSLISDRYVLTAAHCMKSGNLEVMWVRLGELVVDDDSDSSQPRDFRIIERIPHPQYTGSSIYFDIMLLKLREKVQFTPHMRPICLDTSSVWAPALNNYGVITGWVVTATGVEKSKSLLNADISFAADSECIATYKGDKRLAKGYDPATMICAGNKFHGRDTCDGDSGGPLQVPIPNITCMYSQVGIISYGGFICGQRNVSSIYTKISPYIPWIQSIGGGIEGIPSYGKFSRGDSWTTIKLEVPGSSIYFDIMLLKLREKVQFTPHMRPICLDTSSILAPALHNKALITGFGITASGEEDNGQLRKAEISFAADSECTATYKGDKRLAKGYDPATMICAGDKIHGMDTCAVNNVCAKSIKTPEKFDCVATTKCTSLNKLIREGKVVYCGSEVDTSTAKVCCPRSSRRFVRQAEAPSIKDPYSIARQKCNEYSAARYVIRITPSDIPNQPPIKMRMLDCVKFIPGLYITEPRPKEFPHMALIGYSDRPDRPINETQWACGGSLISDRYVLTAAHCMKSGNFEVMWVRLGELVVDDDSDSSQPRDFRIIEQIPHPQYTGSSIYFDIMLLKLREKVQFTPHMRPICLDTSSVWAPALNNYGVITGWVVTATGVEKSKFLMKADVSFAADSECIATYKGDKRLAKGYDPSTMICAGDKFHDRYNCDGDSGGPLQVRIPDMTCMYSQVGIISYGGFICGQRNVSSIYTKISPHIPWIQSIVWP
ncbi:hypothetical protein V9T40_008709 [Parthenolecanium corni]|uniref:Peptidase S1 domain-containing protein n=1 Tax=Parthenolecanium corni TaxID=536013 RepID=A0AAN9U086_9HEMI